MLFKELLYSEIYMASPVELNDPLDLNGELNFFSENEADIKALVLFISKHMLMVCMTEKNYGLVKELMGRAAFEQLNQYITANFSNRNNDVVSKNNLFEILSGFYHENPPDTEGFEIEKLFYALEAQFSQFLNNSSVACFTESCTNFLMWSHYARGHTGVCLEFEVNIDKQDSSIGHFPVIGSEPYEGEIIEWSEKIKKVRYPTSLTTLMFYDYLPIFNNEGDVDLMNLSKSYWHQYANRIEKIFLEKLAPWSEENEWRIVDVSFQETFPEERILKFNSNALTGVYFGAKVSSRTKNRVCKATEKHNCNPAFYKCNVNRTRGIGVEKI